jgi:serine/threonine protein kinase
MKWRPERLDRMERNSYKVIGKISDGGFGEIFKVKSLKSNDLLALKHIKYRGSFSDQNYIGSL